ncbi:MAG TPA: preprotein translocase subunit SecE [Methylomirabilota bacterium]|nr:preprotein translocase subunit SecE [Methylomirabilota bacterium]
MLDSLRGCFVFALKQMTTPVTFLRETYDELKKVVWPTRNQVIRLTLVVISISVAIGLYIGGLDYIFTKVTELVVK